MSSKYGENSKPKATSDAYRNSSYWDKVEEKKRKEKQDNGQLEDKSNE